MARPYQSRPLLMAIHKTSHSYSTTHQHTTWENPHSHSNRPAARLSAAPHSRPLTAFSTSAQPHQRSKKRHPSSDTGDQSRGPSSLPAGHMQISLHDDSKTEWIKWVKFGLNHRGRMKAASELTEEEQPKSNASIDIDQFQEAITFLRSVDRRIPPEIAKKAISLVSSARLLHDFDLSKANLLKAVSRALDSMLQQMWPQIMGQFNTPAIWARLHRYFEDVPTDITLTFVNDDLVGFFLSLEHRRQVNLVCSGNSDCQQRSECQPLLWLKNTAVRSAGKRVRSCLRGD